MKTTRTVIIINTPESEYQMMLVENGKVVLSEHDYRNFFLKSHNLYPSGINGTFKYYYDNNQVVFVDFEEFRSINTNIKCSDIMPIEEAYNITNTPEYVRYF